MSLAMMMALTEPGLTASEHVVYAYLVGRANGAHLCWPKVEDMAPAVNLEQRTVMKATAKLAKMGLIRIESRKRERLPNHYHILDPGGRLYQGTPPHSPQPAREESPASKVIYPTFIEWGMAEDHNQGDDLHKTTGDPDDDLHKTTVDQSDDLNKTAGHDLNKTAGHDLNKTAGQISYKKESKEDSKHTPARARAQACVSDPEGWSEFWDAYPPNDGSPHVARLAYQQALTETTPAHLLAALKAFPFRPGQHTVHAANWLRERRWQAKLPAAKAVSDLEAMVMAKLDAELARGTG
jgi:DNA-binding MarR family transcriptional regulator